jgi:hypothetical protein
VDYASLADRRERKRQDYRKKIELSAVIWRGRFKRMSVPLARIVPVCGTGKHLNHHILYLKYCDIPALIISGHFVKSQAVDVQAACDVAIRAYIGRGWKTSQYTSGLGKDHLLSTIKDLVGAIDDAGEDPFRFFGDKALLKIVKKVVKSYEI